MTKTKHEHSIARKVRITHIPIPELGDLGGSAVSLVGRYADGRGCGARIRPVRRLGRGLREA